MEASPIIYVSNVAIGLFLGVKYGRMCQYMKKNWDMTKRGNRIASRFACMMSFMFISSLCFAFLTTLYRHYISGYEKHADIVAGFVLIGIIPFFLTHFKEVEK